MSSQFRWLVVSLVQWLDTTPVEHVGQGFAVHVPEQRVAATAGRTTVAITIITPLKAIGLYLERLKWRSNLPLYLERGLQYPKNMIKNAA